MYTAESNGAMVLFFLVGILSSKVFDVWENMASGFNIVALRFDFEKTCWFSKLAIF